jgi:membrane fusion protein
VIEVSRSALSPLDVTTLLGQQVPPEPLYRVLVRLAKQNIDAYGKQQALLPGMSVEPTCCSTIAG